MERFNNKSNKDVLYSQSSPEFLFFSGLKIESLEELFRLSPEKFLKMFAPGRLRVFQNAVRKIGFKYESEFVTDLLMPMNVGGYFSPDSKRLAISPLLLMHGSEEEIAHVLFHEGLHAGIFVQGEEILEEVVVETMTKKKMKEIYGTSRFRSGYDGMVNEASEFFGELSFQDMVDQVEDGDEESFDNFLELILIKPALNDLDIKALRWTEIQTKLRTKWSMLKRLFPRTINRIAKNHAGLHEEAKMSAYEYKLEGILEKTAYSIFEENIGLIAEILIDVTDEGKKTLNPDAIEKLLMKEGYGYIFDKEPEAMRKMIFKFAGEIISANYNNREIKAEEIELNLV